MFISLFDCLSGWCLVSVVFGVSLDGFGFRRSAPFFTNRGGFLRLFKVAERVGYGWRLRVCLFVYMIVCKYVWFFDWMVFGLWLGIVWMDFGWLIEVGLR